MAELTSVYGDFTDQITDFHSIAHEKKISVTQEGLGSDVNRLPSLFVEICEADRDRREYTPADGGRAILRVPERGARYVRRVVVGGGVETRHDRHECSRGA